MLALTLDSASNNDTLVATLREKVTAFAGAESQVRCFNHVLNLTAHTVVKQFDLPKSKADGALTEAELALLELAKGSDIEEAFMMEGDDDEAHVDDDSPDLEMDDDGWDDERDALTDEERSALTASVLPVRLILVKVSTNISEERL
jgi:hypothetical protein